VVIHYLTILKQNFVNGVLVKASFIASTIDILASRIAGALKVEVKGVSPDPKNDWQWEVAIICKEEK